MKKYFCIISLLMFSQAAFSEEITEQSFIGKWCGKWDGIYSMCLTIDSIDTNSTAIYQWLEHPNGKFKKDEKNIERVNRNTLKIDNIWFVLDENNLKQASAVGVFRVQSRTAALAKESDRD